jgi:uncharacterized damage-inducible protein DinB
MSGHALPRPQSGEYNEYYGRYIAMVPDGDIVETLSKGFQETLDVLRSVPPEKEEYRYAEGKWSLREVVGHLIDTERLFAFRALWFARGAEGGMPGMDQEAWGRASSAGSRPLSELAGEWAALREANALMFGSFDAETGTRRGVASGHEVTVRALAWMMAGHEVYHRMLLKRDYLEQGG